MGNVSKPASRGIWVDWRYFSIYWKCIKSCNEKSDKRYFLEDDGQYSKKIHELRNNLPFLSEKMKIEKLEKLVANLHNKTEYIVHIINLKQALTHGLIIKKVHRIIKSNQKAWFWEILFYVDESCSS